MAKVTTDENGVAKLTALSNYLGDSTEQVTNATMQMQASFDEKRSLLGPHTNEINEIIETIQVAQSTGQGAVLKVQNGLLDVATAINEFISSGFSTGDVGK